MSCCVLHSVYRAFVLNIGLNCKHIWYPKDDIRTHKVSQKIIYQKKHICRTRLDFVWLFFLNLRELKIFPNSGLFLEDLM